MHQTTACLEVVNPCLTVELLAAGGRGSKAILKPRPANDRAKKAEATFAARRAAALAKGKK